MKIFIITVIIVCTAVLFSCATLKESSFLTKDIKEGAKIIEDFTDEESDIPLRDSAEYEISDGILYVKGISDRDDFINFYTPDKIQQVILRINSSSVSYLSSHTRQYTDNLPEIEPTIFITDNETRTGVWKEKNGKTEISYTSDSDLLNQWIILEMRINSAGQIESLVNGELLSAADVEGRGLPGFSLHNIEGGSCMVDFIVIK